MATYVDAFVLPVPVKKLPRYRKIAAKAGKIWREHGALAFFECAGDDLNVPMGIPYPKLVKPKKGETVVVSFILYKSKTSRNAVVKKVMADKRLHGDMKDMPFDAKRMTFGGFRTIVEA